MIIINTMVAAYYDNGFPDDNYSAIAAANTQRPFLSVVAYFARQTYFLLLLQKVVAAAIFIHTIDKEKVIIVKTLRCVIEIFKFE